MMRCITANILQTKVDAQCDKLATKLRHIVVPSESHNLTYTSWALLYFRTIEFSSSHGYHPQSYGRV